MSADLLKIAAEVVAAREFQVEVGGAPTELPDGIDPQRLTQAVIERQLARLRPESWAGRIKLGWLFTYAEARPRALRAGLVQLAAEIVGHIADLDAREAALVLAKQKLKERAGAAELVGVAG